MAKNTQVNTTKQLTFNILSASTFMDFLKKFIVVEANALLELKTNNTIVIKSFTANRAAVKVGSLNLVDIFDFDDKETPITENIKIGIYFVETFIKMIGIVSEGSTDVFLDIFYEKDDEDEYVATSVNVYNKDLNYNFKCSSKKLFKHIANDVLDKVFHTDDSNFSFDFDTIHLKKLELITSVEKGSNIEIKLVGDQDDKELFFITKNSKWKCDTSVDVSEPNTSITIQKDYLKYLDKEEYKIYINDGKIVFKSSQTETNISFGAVTGDDE